VARVLWTADAQEDLVDLDGSERKAALKAAAKLDTEPDKRGQPLGSRAGGSLATFRKLVVGNRDLRLIFRVEPDGTVVVVWVVAQRADEQCYELATSRLRLHGGQDIASMAGELLDGAFRKRR
jgi:mRNA interferase RelE/StbE